MKKAFEKTLCVIVAACVLATTMSLFACASDAVNNIGTGTVENISMVNFNPETKLPSHINENITTEYIFANRFYSNGTADDLFYFYDQLDATGKKIYDTVKANPLTEEISITFDDYIVGVGATTDEAKSNVVDMITEYVIAGISALCEDYPLIFWINGFGYGYSYRTGTSGSNKTVSVISITLTLNFDTNSHASFDEVKTKTALLEQEVANFEVNGISRYEKVKSIHDSLCALITYPSQQGTFSDGSPWYGPMAHEPTGALLSDATYGNGHYAVCEGYAEAFKLICDREGIPCITVVGTGNGGGHKWNYIKMEDNKWYLVDATWNDQGSSVYYSHLLIGTTTQAPYFSSTTPDSEVHIPEGQLYIGVNFALVYPTLATEAYSFIVIGGNTTSAINDITFDSVNRVVYTGKDVKNLNGKFAVPTGYTTSMSSTTKVTNTLVNITKDDGTKITYIGAMRGDANGNNSVTADDYNLVKNASVTNSKITEGTGAYYGADMNHDGAVDGYDAILLDLYMNGQYSYS